jgi:CheY-like chemotaxis protein
MNSKVILLVEDNPSDIELTKRAFAREHFTNTIVLAEDGQIALDYLFGTGSYADRDLSEIPALILLDLKLPRVGGLEVLRCIRADAHTRRVPVVILTSSREEQDMAASYDLGVNSYIRKPIDFRQFADTIRILGQYWLVVNEQPPAARHP